MQTRVWTDGSWNVKGAACGGWAALIERNGKTEQLVGSDVETSQNQMELIAVCAALERVNGSIEVRVDSTYLADCFNKEWHIRWRRDDKWLTTKREPVKNIDLWKRLFALVEDDDRDVSFVQAKRGFDENNKIVDRLSREAAISLAETLNRL